MTKAIIFDFDQTLFDSSELEYWRSTNKWKYVFANLNKVKLYDGISDLFQKLKFYNIKIGVVSNSPSKYCKKILDAHTLKVDFIVGYHDTVLHKPSPDPINLCISKMNINLSEIIGVGDKEVDMIAYNSAGIKHFLCNWGVNESENQPNYYDIILEPKQILDII